MLQAYARSVMAYRFELDASSRTLLVRFSESVSGLRIDQFYSEAGTQIQRIHPRAVIFDFTEVTSFDVDSAAVHGMAEAPPLITEVSCPRLVVAPSHHIFGMSRMFQILGERSRPALKVVRSMAQALAAIELAQHDFQPLAPD
jgi:hypothetical protein